MNQGPEREFHSVEHDDGAKDSATTRTLSRGLAVLSEVLGAATPPTLTELALKTGLAKATVSRLLGTLVEAGFASQQPSGQAYLPGPVVARWLRSSPMEALLAEQAAPVLDELRDLSGETATLVVPVWPDRVCISSSPSHSPVRAHKAIGETAPLTRGCTGRGFLAFARGAYVDAALQARPLVAMTPASITDTGEFLARLAEERKNGFAMSIGGSFPDMNGIAVPVFAATSTLPVAVINISGPSARWIEKAMTSFVPALKERAARLSAYFTSEALS